jgi:DnaK suppressor protein
MIDQAVTGYSKEMSLSQSVREHALLRMIAESLARLAGGNFGVCLSCSSEIGMARLKAVPWTRYCIECQTRLEGQNR